MDYRVIATTAATDAQLEMVDALNEMIAAHEMNLADVEAEAARLQFACRVEAYDGAADLEY
jgi:hypothetical protein